MAHGGIPAPIVRRFVDQGLGLVEQRAPGSLRQRLEHPSGATMLVLNGDGDWLTVTTVAADLDTATLNLDRAHVVRLRDALNDWLTR